MRIKTKDMILCSMFSALICIFAPVAVPVGTVPVTLGVFIVIFASVVLGAKKSLISVGVYLILGAVGLPVFSFGKAGFPALFGITGGYLWSYIPMCVVCGYISSKVSGRFEFFYTFAGSLSSLCICYLCGTIQYACIGSCSFYQAFSVCVMPFVLIDIVKCFVGTMLGMKIRKKLVKELT